MMFLLHINILMLSLFWKYSVSEETDFCYDREGGLYPKQGDCAKFIYCPSGLVFDCPPLTSFNPEKGICDYIENFKCGVKTKENGKKNGKGSQRNANTSSKKEGNVDNKSGNTEIHKNNNKKHRENVDQLKNVKNEKGISKFHNNKSGKKSKKTKENIERQKNLDKNKNEIELQKNKERIKNRKMQIKVKKQKKVDFRNSKIALRRNENNRKNEKMLGNRDKQEVVGNKIGNIQIHNKAKSRKSKRLQGKSKPGEQLKVENNVSKVTKSGKNSKKGGTPGSSARVRSNNKNIDLHIRKPKDEGFQPTCQPKECTLPSCLCAGSAIPGNIPRHQTPQIILLTFDDAIHKGNVEYIHKLLSGLKNPGNCGDAHLTYFVSNKSTDYNVVNEVYKEGHEIASHSVSHKSVQWFRQGAGRRGWYKEIFDQKKNLEEKGGVKHVKGWRSPFLQLGGDNQFRPLVQSHHIYDSSITVSGRDLTNPPIWPFTLDYPVDEEKCSIPPAPKASYPGFWEFPLTGFIHKGFSCSMFDGCWSPPVNTTDVYEFWDSNFKRHYSSSRAPFPMYGHLAWFVGREGRINGTRKFLKKALKQGDTYILTVSQALQWIKNPVTLSRIKQNGFSRWGCLR